MRLRRLQTEMAGDVRVEWRSFLLRPDPDPSLTLDRFRRYTQSWERAGAEPDAPVFRPWASDAGPPSHSMPPHLVAKAAATLGPEAFEAMHERLLTAYFEESRDPTDPATLAALWVEAGLPREALARVADPALLRTVVEEHNDAVSRDITGVPTAMLGHDGVPVPGALPYETYRRWIVRARG